MSSWHSYPKIYNLGHAAIKNLLDGEVTVEEKVDGSQFSFGIFNGEIKCRSKGKEQVVDAPDKMFNRAIEVVRQLAPILKDGWTYRGEYLNKPSHNALAYDRTPINNIIIFDINDGQESYLSRADKEAEAARIGLEIVPAITVNITNATEIAALMDKVSVLGGQKIEGIVIKNYTKFGNDGKVLMGKHVSEGFKEVHKQTWGESNPGKNDILGFLSFKYKHESRWNKAIQHLREAGQLTDSPKDIGNLMKEVQRDITEECKEEIAQVLLEWAMPKILRAASTGIPEWYKQKLVEKQFEGQNE